MYNFLIYITIVIIFLFIIFILFYYYNYYDNIILEKEEVETDKFSLDQYQSVIRSKEKIINKKSAMVIVGLIPQRYLYWNINVKSEGKIIDTVSMGQFQTAFHGNTIIVIASHSKTITNQIKKDITYEFSKKYPGRHLHFYVIKTSGLTEITFNCFLRKQQIIPKFKVWEYIFCDKNKNLISSEDDLESNYYENTDALNKNQTSKQTSNQISKTSEKIIKNIDSVIYKQCRKECNKDLIKLKNYLDVQSDSNDLLINVTEKYQKDDITNKIIIAAIDHVESRTSIFSRIILYDAESNIPFHYYISGDIISLKDKSFNNIQCIREMIISIPDHITSFYAVEYIYFDPETKTKPNINSIVPFHVYVY